MKKVFVRTPYNYDTDRVTKKSSIKCPEETLTQQHLTEQTDINRIVKTYAKTGVAPGNARNPLEIDFANVTDYHSAMNKIIEGEEAFMQVESGIRERFENDPGKYLNFVQNASEDELIDAGLSAYEKWQKVPAPAPEEPAEGGAQ